MMMARESESFEFMQHTAFVAHLYTFLVSVPRLYLAL